MPVIEQLKNFIRHGKNAVAASVGGDNAVGSAPSSRQQYADDTQQSTNVAPEQKTNFEAAAFIVEEEKLAKSKMPFYPGLERYQLIEKMGDGAFSNVYKALDTITGQKVAVKVVRKYELSSSQRDRHKHLHADMKKRPRATERANILKEVAIMRNLNHPSIVKLLAFSESKDYYYLVLELMEGGELFHRIVKLTYFSEDLSRHVIMQVALGIRYLHEERGVVHRDIKPENLLFDEIPIIPSKQPQVSIHGDEEKEDEGEFIPGVGGGGIGRIKIADFGLSKVVWDEQTMTPCGTVGYTAPEIVKDERYSKAVDMWALGCVLYTLLCGFPPFYDESIQLLTEKVARGYYTFLSPWWDDISASAKDLITHLLCVDPGQRYTIDEFLEHPWIKNESFRPGQNVAAFKTKVNDAVPAADISSSASPDSDMIDAITPTDDKIGGPMTLTPTIPSNTPAKRKDVYTPGVVAMKEVFDVSYAVHRMEEESQRRAILKERLAATNATNDGSLATQQRNIALQNELDEMNGSGGSEEDENEVADMYIKAEDEVEAEREHARRVETLRAGLGKTSLQNAGTDNEDTEIKRRLQKQQRERVAQQLAGERRGVAALPTKPVNKYPYVQQSRQPARAKRVGFELNIDNATLLGRRKANGPVGMQATAVRG